MHLFDSNIVVGGITELHAITSVGEPAIPHGRLGFRRQQNSDAGTAARYDPQKTPIFQ